MRLGGERMGLDEGGNKQENNKANAVDKDGCPLCSFRQGFRDTKT